MRQPIRLPPFVLVVPAALLLAGPPVSAGDTTAPGAGGERMEEMFDAFYAVDLDLEKPYRIEGLKLERDALELSFDRGTLYFTRPIEGVITGAIFTGEGSIRLTPPSKMERKALKREYGKETVEETITEAVLRFSDGTDRDLLAAAKPGAPGGAPPLETWKARTVIQSNSDDLPIDFIEARMNGLTGRDFFVADLNTAGQKWISYNYRGRQRLEVGLYREKSAGTAGKRSYEPWCFFHRKDEYDKNGNYTLMPESDVKDPAALRDVTMTVEIPNTKTVLVDSRVEVEALVDGLQVVRFDLINSLGGDWQDTGRAVEVEAVTDSDGGPLPHLHRYHQLLVKLPRALAKGERVAIGIRAQEDTIIQLTPKSYWIFTTYPWFPQIGHNGGRFTFDWTVKVAKPMTAAGSGDLVREWEEGKMNCGEWRSTSPVQFPSFIFGEFNTAEGSYEREGTKDAISLRLYSIRGGSVAVRGKKENILFNIQQGMKHYEAIFGPFPYKDLDVTQMANGLGFAQSPPGILFLSGLLEGGGGGTKVDQVIFHELAHQWWGNQVGWVGPEDTWISESWAEYSSGLITEGIDPDKFRQMLADWKRDAMDADSHGTIAGAFHSSHRTPLLYSKGPYVIHMLRTWMGWEKFVQLTATLQEKYRNRDINTDTIARETSALLGYDMFPFFDQWIRDQGIPKVRYSWSAAKDADGKYLITIRTRQEDAENFKYMMVPISLDFGSGDPVVILKPLLKADAEVQVKAPARPKDVRIDDQSTQLATFIADKGSRR